MGYQIGQRARLRSGGHAGAALYVRTAVIVRDQDIGYGCEVQGYPAPNESGLWFVPANMLVAYPIASSWAVVKKTTGWSPVPC